MNERAPWVHMVRGDTTLAVRCFGGSGTPVLLLHGLAGHSGEWNGVARQLTASHNVNALDLRGHGRSDRRPTDVTPDSYCRDVQAVVERLDIGPVQLVGQSFGGHIAFLVAARHPDHVSSLTVIEADPDGPKPEVMDRVDTWLSSWPVPFQAISAALSFFAPSSSPQVWVDGLEERDTGLWPRFNKSVLLEALRSLATRSWWDEWRQIRCRTLVVRGERGDLPWGLAQEMEYAVSAASVVTVTGAAVLSRLADDASHPLQGYPDPRSDYGRTPPPSHVTKTAERISWSAYTAGVAGVSLRLKSRQELSLES